MLIDWRAIIAVVVKSVKGCVKYEKERERGTDVFLILWLLQLKGRPEKWQSVCAYCNVMKDKKESPSLCLPLRCLAGHRQIARSLVRQPLVISSASGLLSACPNEIM